MGPETSPLTLLSFRFLFWDTRLAWYAVFPILKLNDVCLFLERLSGSSWADGRTSALPQGWGDGTTFFNLQSLLWTTTVHILGAHAKGLAHRESAVYLKNWRLGSTGTSKCQLGEPLKIQAIWSGEDELEGRSQSSPVDQRRCISVAAGERTRHDEWTELDTMNEQMP